MRGLAFLGVFVAALLGASSTPALGYFLDTPHNESNGIFCYTCHTIEWYTYAPSGGVDDTLFNYVCLRCHDEVPADLAHQGPVKQLHASSTTSASKGDWSTGCSQCHDPHFQGQLDWSGEADLWLAQGDFGTPSNLVFSASDPLGGGYGTTSVAIVNVSGPAGWTDTATWSSKGGNMEATRATDASRGLILAPNKANPTDTYEIVSVSGSTLKVKGNLPSAPNGQTFGVFYGQSLRSLLFPPGGNSPADYRDVKFFQPAIIVGSYGGYIDETPDAAKPLGLCQVCHATTRFWKKDGSLQSHNTNTDCDTCHNILTGGAGGADHALFIADDQAAGPSNTDFCSKCHAAVVASPSSHPHNGCQTCHGPAIPGLNTTAFVGGDTGDPFAALTDNGNYTWDGSGRLQDTFGRTISDGGFSKIKCGECHDTKAIGLEVGTHGGHSGGAFNWNGNCVDCHGPASREVVKDLHGNNCTLCHDPGALLVSDFTVRRDGDPANGIDGDARGATTASGCTDCHSVNTPGQVHHLSATGYAAAGNCTYCHAAAGHQGNHALLVATYVNCATCHAASVGTAGGAPVNAGDTKVHDNCVTCHNPNATLKTLPQVDAARVIAMPNGGVGSNNGGGTCAACHGEYFNSHSNINHAIRVGGAMACVSCHTGTAGSIATVPVSGADNQIHDACATCHNATGTLQAAYGKAPAMAIPGGDCLFCHGSYFQSHPAVDHSARVTGSINCNSCHAGTAGLVTGAPVNSADGKVHDACNTCHDDGTDNLLRAGFGKAPYMAAPGGDCNLCHGAYFPNHTKANHTARVAMNGDCIACHIGTEGTATGVPVDNLNNMLHDACTSCHDGGNGALLGLAAGHSGGGDCQTCHALGGAGHAAVHDFAHVDKPACLRCHLDNVVAEHVVRRGFSCSACHASKVRAVVDNIAAGKAGTNVTCESCHHAQVIFPDGLGKYQAGHHATVQSVTGNCTYCHVVAAGSRAAADMPCLKCHGAGQLADPQRAGVGGHANGPALTTVQDGRVCFSCHLAEGPGYRAGVTPLVTPLHAQPAGFGFDSLGSPAEPLAFPGRGKINLFFPEMRADGISRPNTIGVTDYKYDPVQYNFPAEPYTLVPKTTGGIATWVPSYESGGARGQIAGSGNLRVTIQPAAAISAGAVWREDGAAWETSAATRSGLSPRQHLVEGNYLSGWATPPAAAVTIPADNSTVDATITYEPCPTEATLSLARTSGGGGSSVIWAAEMQQEDFAVGGEIPPGEVRWLLDPGGATGFTVVPGAAATARIVKTGASNAGTYNFTLRVIGSSCPGNEASLALTVTILDTGTGSPQAPPYYGQIGDSVIDTTPLGVTNIQPALFHLAGDLYGVVSPQALLGATPMLIKTFTAGADGQISDFISSFDAGTMHGYNQIAVLGLSATTIAVLRYDTSTTISLRTYSITDNGATISAVGNTVVDAAAVYLQPLAIKHLAGDVYALLHSAKALTTVAIDPDGTISNPLISTWAAINSGIGSNLEHVAGDVYALLTLKDARSQVLTLAIAADGTINQAPIDTFDYQGTGNATHLGAIRRTAAGADVFAIAHATKVSGRDYGTLVTVAIDSSGVISPEVINSHLIDGLSGKNYGILPIVDGVIAVHYGKTVSGYPAKENSDGVIQTFAVSSLGRIEPAAIDYFAVGNAQYFNMIHATGDIYLFANYAADGVKTVKINTGAPLSLAASLSASPGPACGEMSFAVTVEPGLQSGPYFCDFAWGDGTSAETGVPCGAGFSTMHVFAGVSPSAEVSWTVRNNDGYLLHPASKKTAITIPRDLDGDGLCGTDTCPNDPNNDEDGDGNCGTLYAYIASDNGKVAKIRIADESLKETVASGGAGDGLAVAPDNGRVYISNYYGANTAVFDTTANTFSTVASGGGSYGVATSPNNAYLYVATTSNVVVYDTSTMQIVATVPVGTYARGIAASPDGSRVYVIKDSGSLVVIRTQDFSVIDNVAVAGGSYDVTVSPDSKYVYVSNGSAGTVSLVRAADNLVETVNVGATPRGLAASPSGSYLYVANSGGNSVSAIRLADKVVTTITGIPSPYGVSVTPDSSRVYVTSRTTDAVYIIDSASNSVSKSIALGTGGSLSARGRFISAGNPFVPAPNISVSDPVAPFNDNALDLGTIYEGYQSSPQTITVTNDGIADLVIGTLGQDNPLGAAFAMVTDHCSGQVLAAGASCTFDVLFTPPVTGAPAAYHDRVDIPSNDPDENPTLLSVSGLSTVADIDVADELAPVADLLIPFGDRVEGTTLSRQVTVANNGSGGLVLGTIGAGDPLSAPFSLTADTCSGKILAAAASCTFRVGFNPAAVGSFSDTFAIPSNDPDENPLTMTVTGRGTIAGPDITVTDTYSATALAATGLDFGYFDVHAAYLDKSLYVRNDGTDLLNIAAVSLTTDPRSFSLVTDNCTGQALTTTWPANTCSLVLRFDPTTTGVDTFNAMVQVFSDDPDENPAQVALNGGGYQSQYALITNNYTFGGGVCRSPYDLCAPSYSFTPLAISYTATDELTTTAAANISTGAGSPPLGVAATPTYTFFTIPATGRVLVYHTNPRYYVTSLLVGASPAGVAASPDGRYLYVANAGSGTVSVLSQQSPFALQATIPVAAGPTGIDVSPDSALVYVTNATANAVSVISAATNTVLTSVPVGTWPQGLAFSPDGSRVYVANYSSNSVSVLETVGHSVLSTITGLSSPYGVAATPDGQAVYVSNAGGAKVSVIRTSDDTVSATVSNIPAPAGLAATADGKYIYVASNITTTTASDPLGGKVHVIRTADNTVSTSIPTGKGSTAFGRFITTGNYDLDGDGIGDIQDICPASAGSCSEVPTLSAPTATSITSTSATLGATLAPNGVSVSGRGTVWGPAANPTTNYLAEGGTATGSFSQTRNTLPAGTRIYYRGAAIDSQGSGYSPDGSFYTEPASQASAVGFTGIGVTTMTVTWSRGDGDGVIVLMRQGGAVNSDPVDGIYNGYDAQTNFGAGSQIGSGNFVVYHGTGSSVTVSGLSLGTTYHVAVYEFKGLADSAGFDQGTNYKTLAAIGSQSTISVPGVSLPTATAVSRTTATLGATVSGDGGSPLTARGTVFGYVASPTANALAEGGVGLGTFTQARSGLLASQKVYYRGYATNLAGTGYSADGSFHTEPSNQVSAVSTSAPGQTSMTISWTRGNGSGALVLMRQDGPVNADPVDGTYAAYAASPVFGGGSQVGSGNYVVYKGFGTSVTVTGLNPAANYQVALFEYMGAIDSAGVNLGCNYLLPATTANQPLLAAPTATAITSTTALLGATVTSVGGAPLSARGIVWGTSAFPTLATGNVVVEGATTTGLFTQAIGALPAATRIYYRGYATNSAGTSYSPAGSFHTEPASQASGVNFTAVGTTSMTVNWTRGSGDGVFVLLRPGSPINSEPVDGVFTNYTNYIYPYSYAASSQVGAGNYVVYRNLGSSVTLTNLASGTTYHVAVIEYAANGSYNATGNDLGVNYLSPMATGSQITN